MLVVYNVMNAMEKVSWDLRFSTPHHTRTRGRARTSSGSRLRTNAIHFPSVSFTC